MLNDKHTKLKKALAIAAVALQLPFMMLWLITYDAIKLAAHRLEVRPDGGYELVLKSDLLVRAILAYLPVIFAFLACLALSVWGLILMLKRKGNMEFLGICLHAAALVAGGFLLAAFSFSIIPQGSEYMNSLSVWMFCREYLKFDLTLRQLNLILRMIKYGIFGLFMVVNGVLCGLGIADLGRRKKAPSITDDMLYEIKPL